MVTSTPNPQNFLSLHNRQEFKRKFGSLTTLESTEKVHTSKEKPKEEEERKQCYLNKEIKCDLMEPT